MLITEESSYYDHLENKSVAEILSEMNSEDAKVSFAVREVIPQIEKLVSAIVDRMKRGGRLFYIGAGTSGRLGVLDASEIPPTFGMPQGVVIGVIAGGDKALRFPVENAEDDTQQGWKDLQVHEIQTEDVLVGIAASGSTPYVVGALKKAQEHGVFTACISCNPNAAVSEFSDVKIEVVVGSEYVTGSTRLKSGSAEKMILNMISTSVMIKLGRVRGNKMVNMQLTNRKLQNRAVAMLIDELNIDEKKAKNLLAVHGSVQDAIDAFKK